MPKEEIEGTLWKKLLFEKLTQEDPKKEDISDAQQKETA